MAEPLPISADKLILNTSSGKSEKPLKLFEKRVSDELVIAFSGPVGCGISSVIEQTRIALTARGYNVYLIKLSEFIEDAVKTKVVTVPNDDDVVTNANAKRYLDLQNGGNALRSVFSYDILAQYAIKKIVGYRLEQTQANPVANPITAVPKKNAFLIDQIKHPQEVELFRAVYRKLFHLVGVVSVQTKRQNRLEQREQIPSALATRIMERDRKQEEENGQQLDKALKMADFFIRSDRGTVESIHKQMDRFVSLLHGQNGITPTKQEYGMYVAYAAGLRSACLSRQVGAAIEDTNGEIISTGCNDVPKSGGGLYSHEDLGNDKRCVHKEEQICFNDREKALLKNLIYESLRKAKTEANEKIVSDNDLVRVVDDVYKASRIYDLTEFSRAVHAEMDAIITLVRTGTPGIVGSTLYCTTFPCHSCARHIVAAGVKKTYYIEPYEKSLAKALHSDAIEFDTEDNEEAIQINKSDNLPTFSSFIHFEGVAPSQYLNLFKMPKRKDDKGRVVNIAPDVAKKSVSEYLDNYNDFEVKVIDKLSEALRKTTAGEIA